MAGIQEQARTTKPNASSVTLLFSPLHVLASVFALTVDVSRLRSPSTG